MPMDPKRPGLAIVIGAGSPKGSPSPKGPPPSWDDDGPSDQADGASQDPSAQSSQPGGQKVSPEDAGTYTSDQKCTACKYYIHEGHMCQKVDGNQFGLSTIGCTQFFEPEQGGDDEEPDEDDMGLGAPGGGAAASQGDQYGGSNTSTSGQ